MKTFLLSILITTSAFSQTPQPPDGEPAQSVPQAAEPADNRNSNSTLDVKPGAPVIKEKDLYQQSGLFHPFLRMPKYVLHDQQAIWTSPFHTSRGNAKWWAIFGVSTAALIATDQWSVQVLPNSSSQLSVSKWGSRIGAAYTLIPVSAAFYVIGSSRHDEHFRETGLIGFETLIDAALAGEAIKLIADRARPSEAGGKGRFESSSGPRWSSGFPSGHALSTWAMASVIAHEYPHPLIIPIVAYAAAGVVVAARVGARQHFPGDVVAGSAMGWFIGDYVYGKRHNDEFIDKKTFAQKVLSHIRISAEIQ